jgi:hypothetical protein
MVEGEHTKDSLLALPVPSTPPKVRNGRAGSASAKKPPVTITPKSSAAKRQNQRKEPHKGAEAPKSSSSRKRKLPSISPKEKEKAKGEAEEEIYPDFTFENFGTPLDVSHFPIGEKHYETAVASGKKSFSVQKTKKDISADESTTAAERQPLKKLKKSKPEEPKKKETKESRRSDAEGKSVISATLSAVKENLENLDSSVKGVDQRSDDIESWESQQEVLPSADTGSKSKQQKAKPSEDLKEYHHNLKPTELETSFSALESTVTRYPSSEKKGYTEHPESDLYSRSEQVAMDSGRHVEPAEPFVAPVDSNLLSSPRNDRVPSSSYGGIAFAGASADKQVSSCSNHHLYLHFMFRNFMNSSEASHQLPILLWKNKQKDHDYLNYVKVLQNQRSMNQTIKNIKMNSLLVKTKEEKEKEKKL